MSDIKCPRCGEPYDLDCLHEVAAERDVLFIKVYHAFITTGCTALSGEYFGNIPECALDNYAMLRSAMADILGDDVDGYISELEDLGF
jgi:hypothetical protein